MTNLVKKLDSNVTGLRYAEETTIGVLPVASSPMWYPLEPNTYNDFGANTKSVARRPINPSRQLRKGVLTDLDPAAGFSNDLTQDGLTRLLQGFFVANLREPEDSQSFNNNTTPIASVVHSSHEYTVTNNNVFGSLAANDLLSASKFANSQNNGLKVVTSTSGGSAAVAATNTLVSSANYAAGETVTIGGFTYTFRASVAVAYEVLVGGSEAASMLNLHNAINASGGVPGTDYSVPAQNPYVSATDDATHTITVTARAAGASENSVGTTETASNAAWTTTTLAGGSDATATTIVVTDTNVVDETPTSDARLEQVGRQGASGDLTITNDSVNFPHMDATVLDFTTLPLIAGQWIWIGGDVTNSAFATAANNGWARIRSIVTHRLTFDKTSSEMVTDNGAGKTVQFFFGKVLRNEATPAIQKRRTYTMERTLGNPDSDNPTKPQAEYIMGAVPNEITFNMTTAEKVTLDMTFLGTDYTTIDTTGTILSEAIGATAPTIVSEDAFNTTSHVVRAKMSVLSDTDSAPTSLFAEVTELKFSVKNNDKANKAIGKLGPFEITFGFFEGSGSVQAYFDQVASVQAVRTNADVSIDFAMAKNNQGILFDLPLLTLNTKGLDVKINEPIMLPINMTMGADRNFDHTMLMEFFDYLPDLAMPV
jgi:hypothetical protein